VILYIRGNRGALTPQGSRGQHPPHSFRARNGRKALLLLIDPWPHHIGWVGPKHGLRRPPGSGPGAARLGTGVDVVYPRESKKLAEQMLETGGELISEFPMGLR